MFIAVSHPLATQTNIVPLALVYGAIALLGGVSSRAWHDRGCGSVSARGRDSSHRQPGTAGPGRVFRPTEAALVRPLVAAVRHHQWIKLKSLVPGAP
jgi:hypothetical protein